MRLRNRNIDTPSVVAEDNLDRVRMLGRGTRSKSLRQSPPRASGERSADPGGTSTAEAQHDQRPPSFVASSVMQSTTKAGKPRQRMKWSTEVNKEVMRSYYTVTKLETDLVSYRSKLYEHFRNKFPDIDVTEQRVADQRRTIVVRSLIPPATLEKLKQEIAESLVLAAPPPTAGSPDRGADARIGDSSTQIFAQATTRPDTSPTDEHGELDLTTETQLGQSELTVGTQLGAADLPTGDQQHDVRSDFEDKLRFLFLSALTKFRGTDPSNRPALARVTDANPEHRKAVHCIDSAILPDFVQSASTLSDVQTLIYSAAHACTEFLGLDPPRPRKLSQTGVKFVPRWQKRIESDIATLRSDIGRLTDYLNGNRSPKHTKKVKRILKKQNSRQPRQEQS